MLVNDWKSAYYFILHQGNLLFGNVFIIFLRKGWYFVKILILRRNVPTSYFLIEFTSQLFNLFCHQKLNVTRVIENWNKIWNYLFSNGDTYDWINWILQENITCLLIWRSVEADAHSMQEKTYSPHPWINSSVCWFPSFLIWDNWTEYHIFQDESQFQLNIGRYNISANTGF